MATTLGKVRYNPKKAGKIFSLKANESFSLVCPVALLPIKIRTQQFENTHPIGTHFLVK